MDASPDTNPVTGYFRNPFSVEALSNSQRAGMVGITVFAFLSITVITCALSLIVYNRVTKGKAKHGQFVTLIVNLLVADLLQALSFVLELHWLIEGGIFAPNLKCEVQGFLLNLGDVSSGLFILCIAAFTSWVSWRGPTVRDRDLHIIVALVWIISIVVTIIGPLQHGQKFFTAAGNWVSSIVVLRTPQRLRNITVLDLLSLR